MVGKESFPSDKWNVALSGNSWNVQLSDNESASTPMIDSCDNQQTKTEIAFEQKDRRMENGTSKCKKQKLACKRANDRPKRPPCAYNLFFHLERERILRDEGRQADRYVTKADVVRAAAYHLNTRDKRKHVKSHGKISFKEMSRTIASAWNSLPPGERKIYEDQASIENAAFQKRLAAWRSSCTRPSISATMSPRIIPDTTSFPPNLSDFPHGPDNFFDPSVAKVSRVVSTSSACSNHMDFKGQDQEFPTGELSMDYERISWQDHNPSTTLNDAFLDLLCFNPESQPFVSIPREVDIEYSVSSTSMLGENTATVKVADFQFDSTSTQKCDLQDCSQGDPILDLMVMEIFND